MSNPPTQRHHTGWMILGLLAIPFLSVSGVALLADVASTTDPTAAAVGIPAVLGGVLMAALVVRLGRGVHSGSVSLRNALMRVVEGGFDEFVDLVTGRALRPVFRPAVVFVPASIGRRGPPFSSR